MALNIYQGLLLAGLLNGSICLLILVLFPRNRNRSGLYLGLLITSVLANVMQYWLVDIGLLENVKLIYLPWLLLIPVFFLLYIQSLRILHIKTSYWPWYYAPFLFFLCGHIYLKYENFINLNETFSEPFWASNFYILEEVISWLFCLIVIIRVYQIIQKEKKLTKLKGFGINVNVVKWIKLLIKLGAVLSIVWIVSLFKFNHENNRINNFYLLWILMCAAANVLGIVGVVNNFRFGKYLKLNLELENPNIPEAENEFTEVTHIDSKMNLEIPEKYARSNGLPAQIELANKSATAKDVAQLQEVFRNQLLQEFYIDNLDFDLNEEQDIEGKNSALKFKLPYVLQSNQIKHILIEINQDIQLNETELYELRIASEIYSFHLERIGKNRTTKTLNKENKHFQSLLNIILEDEIYTNPNLDLQTVASLLGISSGYLSKLINESTGLGFSDFINAYRVKKTKLLMKNTDYSHYSVVGYGLEAGFNSKSTFYKAFQREEGMTPGQYLKNNNAKKSSE